MNRVFTFLGMSAALIVVAACSKLTPDSSQTIGPKLNPPAASGGDTTSSDTPAADTGSSSAAEGKLDGALGGPGAAWANLEGTDGKTHSLADLAEAEVVAVVFTCNGCPVAKAYEDRLVKFASDYEDKGVELVAINVNKGEAESVPAMKQRAEEKGFNFPYVHDPSQAIAREYGATVTPHAFVLDKDRKVIYMGAIDDNMDESAAKQTYLRDAVNAALAGQAPSVTDTKPTGCGIRYE